MSLERGPFGRRQRFGEQVNIVQPDEVRCVVVMRDAMDTRDQQRVRAIRSDQPLESRRTKTCGLDLFQRQHIRQPVGVRHTPMHVPRVPQAVGVLPAEMTLRRDEIAAGFDVGRVSELDERPRDSGGIVPLDENVSVGSRAQVRCGVTSCGRARRL